MQIRGWHIDKPEWIDVMDVHVVDDKTLAWCDMKGATNTVDFQVPVDLTAFFQGSFFDFGGQTVSALFYTSWIKFPSFEPIGRRKKI